MEGPSLVILKDEASTFIGKKVLEASGAAKLDFDRISGQTITDLRTWGKHFLIVLNDCTIRIHYLMFGNYYINSQHPEKIPKLTMVFKNGEWNNYNCAVKIIEADIDTLYDWSTDVMADSWDAGEALKRVKEHKDMLVCDALLDQSLFTGVGNIMKNEILYRIRLHPESIVGAVPPQKLKELVQESRTYAFDFYNWKKEGTFRKHWLAHTKKVCQRCNLPFTKQHTGHNPRRSFYCTNCQELYS